MSSKKLASLLIKVGVNGAEVEKRFRTIEKSAKVLGDKLKNVGKTMSLYVTAPLVALGTASVAAANTQMQAEAKLLNALKGRRDIQERLLAQASQLQSRSVIGDEAIIEQQAFLAALGLSEKQIGDTIEAAAQLSAALGIELESAVKNLAKTYGGMTGELGESIPALKNLTAEQLKAGEAINYVNANYKGFAETAAATGAGPLVQLKNLLGDLAEQIGVILIPALQKVVGWLKNLVLWFQNLTPEMKEIIVTSAAVVAALGPLASLVGTLVTTFTALTPAVSAFISVLPALGSSLATVLAPVAAVLAGLYAMKEAMESIFVDPANDKLHKAFLKSYDNALSDYKSLSKEGLLSQAETWKKIYEKRNKEFEEDRVSISKAAAANEALAKWKAAAKLYNDSNKSLVTDLAKQTQEIQNLLKNSMGGFSGGSFGGLSEIVEPNGVLAKLQKGIAQLEEKKLWANTAEEIAAINREIKETQWHLDRLANSNGIAVYSASTIALKGSGLGVGLKAGELLPTIDEGAVDKLRAKMIERAEGIRNVMEQVNAIISAAATDVATSLGEFFGDLLVPTEQFDFSKRILEVLGNALKEIGAALITFATTMDAFKKAMKVAWLTPWVAIGIGVAGIAAGSALINLANRPPKLAKGGLAYGPTLAVVGDNPNAASDPEVIAPLSKLKSMGGINRLELTGEVEWKLSGSSLRAVLNKENFRLSRLG